MNGTSPHLSDDRPGPGGGRASTSRPRAAAALAAALLLTAGCGGSAPASPQATEGAAEDEGPAATASGIGSARSAVGDAVIADDFPDPDVLEVDGTYYAYATNYGRTNVRVATSTDLQEWELQKTDALPALPGWMIPGKTWAPEVTRREDGTFVMYPTATNFSPAVQCIAVATATDPLGPFVVQGEGMLVCPDELGGAIDASTFVDADGTTYLLWKNDGNCCDLDTWLYAAPLAPDLLTLAGEPVQLLKQDLPWEGELVEAPTMVERDGTYVLLYSANGYYGGEYATGYATADAVTGPWTKDPEPLLSTEKSDGELIGPGGQDVVVAPDGSDVLVFHAWDDALTYRGMYTAPLGWVDGKPVVQLD